MEILSAKKFAKQLTDMTFTDYYTRMSLLNRSVFKWENLPEGMTERWIEKFLFTDGKCVVFRKNDCGLMVMRCTDSGLINPLEDPTEVRPYGVGYTGENLTIGKDCVLLRNNDDMIPTSFYTKLFAYRLAEITRSIDINVHAMRTPVLITGSEKQKKSLKALYTNYDSFEPVIFGDKSLDNIDVKVMKTDAPIVFPQLHEMKQNVWNEYLTFSGINNANTDKRERLITGEVEANNTHIELSAECFLKARQEGCENINNLFGTEIKVSMRERGEIECMLNTQLC